MTSVALAGEQIYLGMDVSRDKIAVVVLRPRENVPAGRGDEPRRGDGAAAYRQVRRPVATGGLL